MDTFDIQSDVNDQDVVDLDSKLVSLSKHFGDYQRSLIQVINKKLGDDIVKRDVLIGQIADEKVPLLVKVERNDVT